jgi:hypothetical protein
MVKMTPTHVVNGVKRNIGVLLKGREKLNVDKFLCHLTCNLKHMFMPAVGGPEGYVVVMAGAMELVERACVGRTEETFTNGNLKNLFLAAVCVSSKMEEDLGPGNKELAEMFCADVAQVNTWEMDLVEAIKWKVAVLPEAIMSRVESWLEI